MTSMKLKKIFLLLSCVIVLAVAGIWYFIFYRPTHYQRDILSEQAITVTAEELVKKYETNEQEANNLFLNKVIAVTGKVAETGKKPSGKNNYLFTKHRSFFQCIMHHEISRSGFAGS